MSDALQTWIEALRADPESAVDDLVRGRAPLGSRSRSTLGEVFLDAAETAPAELDLGVYEWLKSHVDNPNPDGLSNQVWASLLQDVFRAVTDLELEQFEKFLRGHIGNLRLWLRPFHVSEALDPEAACLSALAWARTNQSLNRQWRKLVVGREPFPEYYREIGLADVPDTKLAPAIEEEDWRMLAVTLLSGYRLSNEHWAKEFAAVLRQRKSSRNGVDWLKRLLDVKTFTRARVANIEAAATLPEKNQLVSEISSHGPQHVGQRLQSYLERERTYATLTGNPHFLVRTFNRLAEAAKRHDPEWAVARSEEAREWDRGNGWNWTVLARCLWSHAESLHEGGDVPAAEVRANEAFDVAWEARFRFGYDGYLRTELARLHREAGDLATAEAIYREAVTDFPADAACRSGLAEVLAELERYPEAEDVYRRTDLDLKPDPIVRCGLANVLRLQGKTEPAKELYREVIRDFPNDPYAYNGLAEICFHQSAETDNEELKREARELFEHAKQLGNKYAANFLVQFEKRWHDTAAGRRTTKKKKQRHFRISASSKNQGPAERLGRALLLQWQAGRADSPDREQLFDQAEQLLRLDDSLTGECFHAFIEARGFLLIARGQHSEAKTYFEHRLQQHSTRGMRLGLLHARYHLNEDLSDDDLQPIIEFGESASLLPTVLCVMRALRKTGTEELLRRWLMEIFPRVRELAMESSDGGNTKHESSPDTMLAGFLFKQFFEPTGIQGNDDLLDDQKLALLRNAWLVSGHTLSEVLDKLMFSLSA
jgi:tetratricopeptide (TPR) repeat protein